MPKLRFSYLFRVILLVMLAGTVVSSCCRHSKVIMLDEIQLGATSVRTKALITDKQSLIDLSYEDSTGFGVYGYKNIKRNGTNTYTFRQFNNVLVYPTNKTEDGGWTYSPKRYWDKDPDASYQFAAYWPYMISDDDQPQAGETYVSEALNSKVLYINDIPNWQPDSTGNDILVATRRGKYGDAYLTPKVSFNFEHILANIIVRAYYVGIKENHVNVLNMQLSGTNMLTTNGNADYTLPFGDPDNAPAKGFGQISRGNSAQTLYTAASQAQAITLPETTWYNDNQNNPNTYGYETLCSWFVIPSAGWQGLQLDVAYSLGDKTQTPAPTRMDGQPITGIAWNTVTADSTYSGQTLPQYKYVITLKFNSAGNGVDLESVWVANWEDVNINASVYNW